MNHLLSYFVLCRCPVAEHPADVLRLVESRSGQQHPLTGLIITNVCKQNQGNPFCVPPTAFREETCDTAPSAFAFPPPADSKKSMSVEALALFCSQSLLKYFGCSFPPRACRWGGGVVWPGGCQKEQGRRAPIASTRLANWSGNLEHDSNQFTQFSETPGRFLPSRLALVVCLPAVCCLPMRQVVG